MSAQAPARRTATGDRALTRKERELLRDEPVAVRIRHARKKAGLTQQQLADLIGADRIQVVHWESGRVRPARKYRQGMAAATGYPIRFLSHDGPGGSDA